MGLPAQESVDAKMVFVEKLMDGVIRVYNGSGSAVNQGDFMIINGLVGVVLQDAIATGYFDFQYDDQIEVEANDLATGAATFGTLYQKVYFNPTTAKFADNSLYGIEVGFLSQIKDSAGCIKFIKTKKELRSGDILDVEINITADATLGIEYFPGIAYKLLDVVGYSTATKTSETLTISDGTAAISNALDIDTVDIRVVPTTLDETYTDIAVTEALTFSSLTADGRVRFVIKIKVA